MPPHIRKIRVVRPTLLVVGEGKAEVALAALLRSLYTRDGQGKAITIRDAQGKGAGNVVNAAIRHKKYGNYDGVCALLDTDTDWNEAVQARARKGCIHVVASDPCLEAVVLEILGERSTGTTSELKERFNRVVGGEAHSDGVIARLLSRDLLDNARPRVEILHVLLASFGV